MFPETIEKVEKFLPNSPLEKFNDILLAEFEVNLFIKRDDLINPVISGNKFRKLKYSVVKYHLENYPGIVSFGGAWSNHLHALSYLAYKFSIPLVVIIRGEKPNALSETLKDIIATGAKVKYVSRSEYKKFRELNCHGEINQLKIFEAWKDYLFIPEGGLMAEALKGVAELIHEDNREYHSIYLPCGTATTLAGLCEGIAIKAETKITGIAALKAGNSLNENVVRLLSKSNHKKVNWEINNDFHFGGFAKTDSNLIHFMNQLYERTGLVTEPIYTGKTFYALYEHIKQGRFPKGSNIMILHTGGLQGLRGFKNKGLDLLMEQASKILKINHEHYQLSTLSIMNTINYEH